jgi:hypothetical protein
MSVRSYPYAGPPLMAGLYLESELASERVIGRVKPWAAQR